MAVYTHVAAEDMANLLETYGIGPLISAKGVAEGVENSNYLLDTAQGRYFLTLYEKRVNADDLPFFIDLIDHLANRGNPVPRILADNSGVHVQSLAGRPACLIQYLPGLSLDRPSGRHAWAVGAALAKLHLDVADFDGGPDNKLSLTGWQALAAQIGDRFDLIAPGLGDDVASELDYLAAQWPVGLPQSVIHADLFPDNVLVSGEHVSGLIDFYFACRDITAYDLAVTHSAWAFSGDGSHYQPSLAHALIRGYETVRPLSFAERDAFPLLVRGASIRFLLTRALDWLETPADAMVVRKDPLAYRRRLDHYRHASTTDLFGA